MAHAFGFYQIILLLNKVFSGKPPASRSKAFYPISETLKNLKTNILTTIEKILNTTCLLYSKIKYTKPPGLLLKVVQKLLQTYGIAAYTTKCFPLQFGLLVWNEVKVGIGRLYVAESWIYCNYVLVWCVNKIR